MELNEDRDAVVLRDVRGNHVVQFPQRKLLGRDLGIVEWDLFYWKFI